MTTDNRPLIPAERIERAIWLIRGEKVMLDAELAKLYGVATKALVQAVKRNAKRFPPEFMFQLSKEELEHWRSQIVTSNPSAKRDCGGALMPSRNTAWLCFPLPSTARAPSR